MPVRHRTHFTEPGRRKTCPPDLEGKLRNPECRKEQLEAQLVEINELINALKQYILKNTYVYKVVYSQFTMDKQYKMVKFKLSSWNKLRRQFYGRKNETFSDYIERVAKEIKKLSRWEGEGMPAWKRKQI